ncbi:D-glycero-beta-D-manno-heptose 1-phosphate adenylyltransferase [Candidatus Poribacteria bacterium]|nr:D-glycero-beta-D-manno-heptose 1-phosphate adenylyltransferase [Candidatus Poribacteria bacterium]|tara:strand:- start:237 stop:725 length:489 start_codon:yes stop_codon:yes gene_type:complete
MTIQLPGKIRTSEQLSQIIRKKKALGEVVVSTNGCFDLLHVGHLRYLKAAKKMGDILVVGVNSDESVRYLKGDNRPLVPEMERAEMLSGLDCVDYVVIFSEPDPRNLLSTLKPTIHVKGGDYSIEQVIERDVVEENGGRVIVGINVAGKSTTNVIQMIRDLY